MCLSLSSLKHLQKSEYNSNKCGDREAVLLQQPPHRYGIRRWSCSPPERWQNCSHTQGDLTELEEALLSWPSTVRFREGAIHKYGCKGPDPDQTKLGMGCGHLYFYQLYESVCYKTRFITTFIMCLWFGSAFASPQGACRPNAETAEFPICVNIYSCNWKPI